MLNAIYEFHLIFAIVNCAGGCKLDKRVHVEGRYVSDSHIRTIVYAVVLRS